MNGMVSGVTDKHPAIMVKPAILARSGIYVYGRDEMLAMGFTLAEDKPFYKVYRPPHVLIEAKDKFCFAVVTKEHTAFDTSPENFREQAEGVVGDSVEVVTLDNGNVGLKGKIAFYTKDVADYFESGNKETSAQYRMGLAPSTDPTRDGYDFVMTGIESVNGLAITAKGRGGKSVRVLDSTAIIDTVIGGMKMGGFLSFLGIGKAKDAGFKFSDTLFGGMAKVKALDAADTAGIEKAVGEVMSHVVSLGDSEAKDILTGAVSDCLKNIEAVLAKKDDVAKKIDALYGKCQDADAEAVKRILDADGKKDGDGKDPKKEGGEGDDKEPKKEGDGKDTQTKDFDSVIATAIDKAFDKFNESIDAKIDAAMKKALGTDTLGKPAADSRSASAADGGLDNEDASYLVRGVFGNR
jgi:hypothetical protein